MIARRQPPAEAAPPWTAWLGTVALLGATGLGCVPEPEPPVDDGVVETAHLRITNSTGNPICAGTPVFLERELERIATAMELPLWAEDYKLDMRFGEEAVAEACPSWDPDHIAGCVGHDDDGRLAAAAEVAYTASHELVHAIRLENGVWSTAMFEEGLAGILSGSAGFPVYVSYPHGDSFVGPLEMLEVPREDFAAYYGPAESFVSWLWEIRGRSTLMELLNDSSFDGAEAALPLFEQHYGLPLADAEQAWRIDERTEPVWGVPCIPERTYSLADGPVELSGELDCKEPTVYGAAYLMALWPMCLDVPMTTRVRVSLEADHGRLSILSREPCDAGPAGAEAYRDKYLDAGVVLEEDIAGCRYRMLLSSQEPGVPPTPYTIRIEEIDG
jgi:hypothetical protein